jgi:hypothetical protein
LRILLTAIFSFRDTPNGVFHNKSILPFLRCNHRARQSEWARRGGQCVD